MTDNAESAVERWQDHYAETEVFLNERGELDPLGAAYVEWSGANRIFDAAIAELKAEVERLKAERDAEDKENIELHGKLSSEWQRAEVAEAERDRLIDAHAKYHPSCDDCYDAAHKEE